MLGWAMHLMKMHSCNVKQVIQQHTALRAGHSLGLAQVADLLILTESQSC